MRIYHRDGSHKHEENSLRGIRYATASVKPQRVVPAPRTSVQPKATAASSSAPRPRRLS